MKQPTLEELLKKLSAVLEGQLTREEVSDWVCNYVYADEIEVSDFLVWDLLTIMTAIDMPDFDKPQYLYSKKDLQAWLQEYVEKSQLERQ